MTVDNLSSDITDLRDAYVNLFLQVFPDAVVSGVWKPVTARTIDSVRRTFTGSPNRKYKTSRHDKDLNVFAEATQLRDEFRAQHRALVNTRLSADQERNLREATKTSAIEALQSYHRAGTVQIERFFDRSLPYNERVLAFRRATRIIDHTLDIYAKLPNVTGENFRTHARNAELLQSGFREQGIKELTNCDPRVQKALSPDTWWANASEGLKEIAAVRGAITADIMLHSIKRVNPRGPQGEEIDDGGTIDFSSVLREEANNREYNCTRVVPATIGVVFGGKVKALAAHDDMVKDIPMQTDALAAYENVYGGKFRNVTDIHQLFNALERSPEGTVGIIHHDYDNERFSHVSVACNIAGVACIVEGQSSTVIVRNPQTNSFNAYSRVGNGSLQIRSWNPSHHTNFSFLEVHKAVEKTEFERAHAVSAQLHDRYIKLGTSPRQTPLAAPKKQWHVPPPPPPPMER